MEKNETIKNETDEEIKKLYSESLEKVGNCLKSINIALKLNTPRKGSGKELGRNFDSLTKWKQSLDYWKEIYGSENDPESMAESLGLLYTIFSSMENT